MNVRTFTAVIHKEEDIYVAECPEVFSQRLMDYLSYGLILVLTIIEK
jgi:hypothetical protein